MSERLRFRSVATKMSVFTAALVTWVVVVLLGYNIQINNFRIGSFDFLKLGVVGLAVLLVSAAIARFTIRVLIEPLRQLHEATTVVRSGRLVEIPVRPTGDEIEYLAESFNEMIRALALSQQEVKRYQDSLEDKIRERTNELERRTQEALEASQSKSEFLANMSHELRTPMSGVMGMLDLVLDSPLSSEQREQLTGARRCAHSLLALLNDLLDMSKIEAGRMVLEEVPFDIRSVIEDCARTHLPQAREKGVVLRWQTANEVPRLVLGDPLRFRQIVSNLLSNAVKFTSEGEVAVLLERDIDARIQLSVRDTGMGIPSRKLPLIFEKFTQADGSISRRFGGTGLGLAITRMLVDVMQGAINVESVERRGSCFTVTLPFPSTEEEEAAAPEHLRSVEKALNGPRILLVEDNTINQKVVCGLLGKRGYTIDVARNGMEALEKLEKIEYAMVLMDVQMPVLDGLETTRCIRADVRFITLPIVAMTAHAMAGDRESCLRAGMNGYLAKPVDHAQLLSIVEHYTKPLNRLRHALEANEPIAPVPAPSAIQ